MPGVVVTVQVTVKLFEAVVGVQSLPLALKVVVTEQALAGTV